MPSVMPHSTTDLPSQDASNTKTMTSTASRLNGGPSSTSLDNKWKRASLPASSDAYGDTRRGRSGSIISNTSTALTHRKYYDAMQINGRDKVTRDFPLIAELRTNVIIKDEYTLVTDLSYHLATRYSKPDASIMINIDHSSCLALAGTFDPCYILTITTVPSYMSASLNKRNASLIQSFMADILSVPPDRGIIRFIAIPEENYAMNGNTMLGEIERAEKESGENGGKRNGVPSAKRSTTDLDQRQKGEKERRVERRRSAAVNSSSEVFELATEANDNSGTSDGQTFAAENGLRMNGISKEDLTGSAARTPNGRPKTIAGRPSSPISTSMESIPVAKSKHISTIARPDQQKAAHMPKPQPHLNTKPARQQSTGAKSDRTPLTPVTLKETIVDNPKVLKDADTDTAANTTKRRSTISATPKMPAPPPIPETKTPKVSKRKSFLAAFRR